MLFYEFADKRKAVEHAHSCLLSCLQTQFPYLIFLIRTKRKTVLAKLFQQYLKCLKLCLKAAVFKKSKIVDWKLRVKVGEGQACSMWRPGHPFATLLLLIAGLLTSRKPAN